MLWIFTVKHVSNIFANLYLFLLNASILVYDQQIWNKNEFQHSVLNIAKNKERSVSENVFFNEKSYLKIHLLKSDLNCTIKKINLFLTRRSLACFAGRVFLRQSKKIQIWVNLNIFVFVQIGGMLLFLWFLWFLVSMCLLAALAGKKHTNSKSHAAMTNSYDSPASLLTALAGKISTRIF